MFPAAFTEQIPMKSEGVEDKAEETLADDHYEIDGIDDPYDATAHQSSVSQGSRGYGSNDSDDSAEAERQPETQQPLFRIERIKSEYQQFDCETPIRNGRKRRNDDSGLMKNPAAKRVANANADVSSKASNEVVIIEDDEDTEMPSTSTHSNRERRPSTNDGNYNLVVQELKDISGKIALHDQKKKDLLEQQAIIEEKLRKCLKNATQ